MSITLYCDYGSPPCRAILLGAAAIGVPLTIKEISVVTGEQLKPEFLKINPTHKLPTIEDNGLVLSESRAILQYFANSYGRNDNIYPKDPKRRAIVDHRLFFDLEYLQCEFAANYYPAMFRGVPVTDEKLKKLRQGLDALSGYLEKTKFAAADTLTIADFSIVTTLSSLEAVGFNLKEFPKVATYYDECQHHIKNYDELNSKGQERFNEFAKTLANK